MSTETTAYLKRLKSQLIIQRLYNNGNTLANLTDTLLSRMNEAAEISVDDAEMDKINEEIAKLQDRLIKAVKTE